MKLFLCKLIFSCAAASQPSVTPHTELVYGTVLYDYYQQNYSDALLQVRVAQLQGHTQGAEVKFKLAEGSFAFSDQMFAYASDTFASVNPAELTRIDSLRLAFHLSREHFRVGDWASLAAQLARIDLGTSGFFNRQLFHPEVEFMRSELAMRQGKLEVAAEHLDVLDKDDIFRLYGLYNLGGMLRAAGELESAENAFKQIARIRPATLEGEDLQERALLASAFLQRETGKTGRAEKILGNLPANGRYRDLALAAFGTLAMENGDYELAARVWLSLQQQPLWTPSTASARMGFPMSLEHLERRDLALVHYRAAEESFSARAVKLDELAQRADDQAWVRELLDVFADGRTNPELLEQWQAQLGHTDWLEWLSKESVDSLLAQWRELRNTQDWLAELPDDLATYEELALEQQRRAQAVKTALASDGLSARHRELEAQIDAQVDALEALKTAEVTPSLAQMMALASEEQQERLATLESLYQVSANVGASDRQKWQARLDRVRGVLFWEIAYQSPVVLQKMQRTIADLEKLSAGMQAQAARLQAAEEGLQSGLLANFDSYTSRAGLLAARVEGALEQREQQLAVKLKEGMQREAEQVQQYLLTARIAIARTLDQYAVVEAPGGASDAQ